MPVEESGNMLILAAALARLDPQGEKETLQENLPLYGKWVKYLLQYGSDPGEQLCTDDFAGHMAHNSSGLRASVAASLLTQVQHLSGMHDALGLNPTWG